jgi:hypothetical protein
MHSPQALRSRTILFAAYQTDGLGRPQRAKKAVGKAKGAPFSNGQVGYANLFNARHNN